MTARRGQRLLFALLVAVPLFGLWLAVADKFEHLGQPNVGWMMDEDYVSPTRMTRRKPACAAAAGAEINGREVGNGSTSRSHAGRVDTENGASNRLA